MAGGNYAGIDELVSYDRELTTIRALYRAGDIELRQVENFRESRSRAGRRWFADLVSGANERDRVGWMIRQRDYLELRRNEVQGQIIRPVETPGDRSRPSSLAGRLCLA
jgi:hypothetical protein